MESTATSLQKLEEIHDIILQSIAHRLEERMEQSIHTRKENLGNRLSDIVVSIGAELEKKSDLPIKKTTAALENHVAILKQQDLINKDNASLIKEVVQSFKETELLSQKLEMAYNATKEFIEQHEQGFSKEEIQKLVQENLLAQQLSKEESAFLTAAVDNALDNEYKPTGKFAEKEKGISNAMLSQLTQQPERKSNELPKNERKQSSLKTRKNPKI
ncbi:hypothetical protein [Aquimarina sp. LLG6339-5]|uniref:hypothetical protein n=1 Tax=Aquimarina sp. LLG6339-5 TaxID=3160830 RepID=UPI003865DE88